MRILTTLFFLLFLHSTAFATKRMDDDKYPFHDPYLATLTSLLTAAPDFKTTVAELEFKPERRNVRLSEGRHRLNINYKIKSPDAPLVFIISGLGGTSDSGASLFLASTMFEMGYSVVTLPNPFSWKFVIGGSLNGRVGFGPQDSRDLYDFMKFAQAYLVRTKKIAPRSYAIMGYSMGALYTGFILKVDREENYFQFKRALMFNPPLDISYGITMLDELYLSGNTLSESRRMWIQGYILDFASRLGEMAKRGMSLVEICNSIKLKPRDIKWAMGDVFHSELRDVMLAGQQVEDVGVFRSPYTKYNRNARTMEASAYTFFNYLEKIFYPFSGRTDTLEETLYAGSLMSLMSFFKNDAAAFLFHNEDDFLYQKELDSTFDETFGDRHFLFKHGGHVGNLWFPINQAVIRNVMSGL